MCLADLVGIATQEMNEGVVEECERCDGSGKVGHGHSNAPEPDYYETCGHCGGEGVVLIAADAADEERIAEESCSTA